MGTAEPAAGAFAPRIGRAGAPVKAGRQGGMCAVAYFDIVTLIFGGRISTA